VTAKSKLHPTALTRAIQIVGSPGISGRLFLYYAPCFYIQLIDVRSFWLDDGDCSLNHFEKKSAILMTADRFVQRVWKFLLFWIFNFAEFLIYELYGRVSIPRKCVRFLTS
jgi:hypothetical protein